MRLRNRIGRVVAGGLALSGLLAAAPAIAQTADLALTVKGTAPASIWFGKTRTYAYTITNHGPSSAQGVAISLAVPATAAVTAVTGCTLVTPNATANVYVCDVGTISDVSGANAVSVGFTVKYTVPSPLPTTCPAAGDVLGPITAHVTATTTTAAVADIVQNTPIKGWTDLGIAMTSPQSAKVGDDIPYAVTVTNNGPCPATGVVVTDNNGVSTAANYPDNMSFVSTTGDCTVDPLGADGCAWDTLAVGESKHFTVTYKVGPQPDVAQVMMITGLDVAADQADLVAANDAAETAALVSLKSPGGCSSAGLGGPLALLGVAALFARRRRS